ncbi:MAG: formylglycine-generating enzyme family protein [Tissierellales bacterium]|nr:formylglycine-generating enzyme family protein [Tissierellales bacterium]
MMRRKIIIFGAVFLIAYSVAETEIIQKEQHLLIDVGPTNQMEFVRIPNGEFLMGSPVDEEGHKTDEEPIRRIKITSPFFMGVYEVTEEQFKLVTGEKPPIQRGAGKPAFGVTWDQANEFCNLLSKITGKPIRLPTEAEWEYACRAGSKTRYWFGNKREELLENDWCGKNSSDEPKTVGTKKANPWGLYDMHGNAVEWCLDWYAPYESDHLDNPYGPLTGEFRVARGGSFFRYPNDCRSATRSKFSPEYSGGTIGFRVVIAENIKKPITQQLTNKTVGQPANANDRLNFTVQESHIGEEGESVLVSFLIAFGKVFLLALVTSVIVGIGKYIFTKLKREQNENSTLDNAVDDAGRMDKQPSAGCD